jgi:hypothetical protein
MMRVFESGDFDLINEMAPIDAAFSLSELVGQLIAKATRHNDGERQRLAREKLLADLVDDICAAMQEYDAESVT